MMPETLGTGPPRSACTRRCTAALLFVHALLYIPAAAAQDQKAVPPFGEWAGKTILVISPHPDDDIIGAGGGLALLSGRKNRLVVVYLSAGEKGTFDSSLTPDEVRTIRKREAAAAYRTLGFPDAELVWLDYPDGELDFAPQLEIRRKLVSLIRRRRPDVIFALDPGGKFYRYHYRATEAPRWSRQTQLGPPCGPLSIQNRGSQRFGFRTSSTSTRQSRISSSRSRRSMTENWLPWHSTGLDSLRPLGNTDRTVQRPLGQIWSSSYPS